MMPVREISQVPEDARVGEAAPGTPAIVRFEVQFESTGRTAVGYRVPTGTPMEEVYKEILRSGGPDGGSLHAPSVFVGSGEERGDPAQLLGDRFWGRWGTNKAWALESYRAKMTECFHGIARALAIEGGWFVAAGGRDVLLADLFALGLAEAALREPGVLETTVSIFCYTCRPGEDGTCLAPSFRGVEGVGKVQDGGSVVLPNPNQEDGQDAATEVNAYATHCIFLEEPVGEATAQDGPLVSPLEEHLRKTRVPRVAISTAGYAGEVVNNFCRTVETAREGALIINLYNSHINANFLAGLLHETGASSNTRLSKRELEYLNKLNEEVGQTDDRAFHREIKATEMDMLRMERLFSTTYLGDSLLLKSAEQLVKMSATGEQKLSLEYELPDDVPLKNFITFDVRACCCTDVAVELTHRLRAMVRRNDTEDFDPDRSEAQTVSQCWHVHDSMRRAADDAEAGAFRLQVVSFAFALLAAACAVLSYNPDGVAGGAFVHALGHVRPSRVQWFSWRTVFLLVVVAAVQVYQPLLRWRFCTQASAIAKSYIYRFRTRTGDFKVRPCLLHGRARARNVQKQASPRVVLVDALTHLKRELASQGLPSVLFRSPLVRLMPPAPLAHEDDLEQPLLAKSSGPSCVQYASIDDAGDDGLEDMDSDEYVSWRATPLKQQLRGLERGLARSQVAHRACVLLCLLTAAALAAQRRLALLAFLPALFAVAGAVQSWLCLLCVPGRLENCRRAVEMIDEVLAWYGSLDSVQRCAPGTLERLVDVVETASMAEATAIASSAWRRSR